MKTAIFSVHTFDSSAFDRMLGIRLGVAAVEAIVAGKKNVMVGILNNQISSTPFEQVVKFHRLNTDLEKLMELFSSQEGQNKELPKTHNL